MLQQYFSIKNDPQYRGYILLFQLGNFLEAFFDDAVILSRTLGIALTSRGTTADGTQIPMAGVPLWAKDGYISRLVRAGHRVVLCEQIDAGSQSPQSSYMRGPRGAAAKGAAGVGAAAAASGTTVMRRQVTQVVTRGTAMDDALLSPRSRNLIAGLAFERTSSAASESAAATASLTAAVCWVDVSTGDFFTTRCPIDSLAAELAVHSPVEVIVPSSAALHAGSTPTGVTVKGDGRAASSSSSLSIEQLAAGLHELRRGAGAAAATSLSQASGLLLERLCELGLRVRDESSAAAASSSATRTASIGSTFGAAGGSGAGAASSAGSHSHSNAWLLDIPGSGGGAEGELCTVSFLRPAAFSPEEGAAVVAASIAGGGVVLPAAAGDAAGAGDDASAAAAAASSGLSQLELAAAAGTLRYIAWTQQGKLPVLRPPVRVASASGVALDVPAATQAAPAESRAASAAAATAFAAAAATTSVSAFDSIGGIPSLDAFDAFSLGAAAGATAPSAALAATPRQAPAHHMPAPAATASMAPPPAGWLQAAAAAAGGALPRLSIDPSTRRSLEISRPLHGRRRARGCLLHTLDLCATTLGSRLLDQRLAAPLAHAPLLEHRLDAVQFLLQRAPLRETLRACLAHVPDVERSLHRAALRRGAPPTLMRDLLLLRDGLAAAVRVGALLGSGDANAFHVRRAGLRSPGATAEGEVDAASSSSSAAVDGAVDSAGDDALAASAAAAPAAAATVVPVDASTGAVALASSSPVATHAAFFISSLPAGLQGMAAPAPVLAPLAAAAMQKAAGASAGSRADTGVADAAFSGVAAGGRFAAAVGVVQQRLHGLIASWAQSSSAAPAPDAGKGKGKAASARNAAALQTRSQVSQEQLASLLVDAGARLDFDLALPMPPHLRLQSTAAPASAKAGDDETAMLVEAPILALAAAAALMPHVAAASTASIANGAPASVKSGLLPVASLYAELCAALEPPVAPILTHLHGTHATDVAGAATAAAGTSKRRGSAAGTPDATSSGSAFTDAAASAVDGAKDASGKERDRLSVRIRDGYNRELDAARSLRDSASSALSALTEELRAATGVRTLKVKITEEHGVTAEVPAAVAHIIETCRSPALAARSRDGEEQSATNAVAAGAATKAAAKAKAPASAAAAAPAAAAFRRLKTLKATVRYTCPALAQLDVELREAGSRAAAMEDAILNDLCARVATAAPQVAAVARAVAAIDVTAALAEAADQYSLCRPEFVPVAASSAGAAGTSAAAAVPVPGRHNMDLRGLRHLVVERSLMEGWVSRHTGNALAGLAALSAEADGADFAASAAGARAAAALDRDDGDDGDDADDRAPAGRAVLMGSEAALSRSGVAAAASGGSGGASAADELEARDLPEDPAPPTPFIPNDCTLGWITPPPPAAAPGAASGSRSKGKETDAVAGVSPAPSPAVTFTPGLQSGGHACLLTGSNMAGKSTYLRSVAHAVLLAQAGSFVPAASARFSPVDALFARVGANDDVSRGRSTFLVEMEETAAILARATAASVVLVDEVGRGTAAADGVGIAWAVLEHLAWRLRCRSLFATHVHELTAMALLVEAGKAKQAATAASAAAASSNAPAAQWEPFVPSIQCRVMEAQEDLLQLQVAAGTVPDSSAADAANAAVAAPTIPLITHRLAPHHLVDFVQRFVEQQEQQRTSSDGVPQRTLEDELWPRVSSLSHGIAVAARAGLPQAVLARATEVARCVESSAATLVWGRGVSTLLSKRAPN